MSPPRTSVGEADGSGEDARRSHWPQPPSPAARSPVPAEQGRAIAHFLEPDAVTFVDEQHVRWRVVERDARHDPGARAARCLVFDCGEAVRRVWTYPAGWRGLSQDALIALSRGR
jgi:hypothetical protein